MASDDDGESPWTRPSVFLSIAFLVLALVGGGFVLLRSHSTAPAATPAAGAVVSASAVGVSTGTPSPTLTTTTTATPAGTPTPSATALPDQTIPVTAPPATWITVATLSLPTSPLYGPKVDDGTVMAGYQHSPTGALFAVADNRGRFGAVANWRAATLSAVANTGGRAAFLLIRAPAGVVTPTPGEFTQLAGFNYLSYTPDKAVVQFLNTASDGSLLTTVDTVIWQDGDWKVLLPITGETPLGSVAQSAEGFTPWEDER